MKLSKALEGFLLVKLADGLSDRTADIYRWALSRLVSYLGDPEVESITTDRLRDFLRYLRDDYVPTRSGGDTRPLAPESLRNAWRAIKSFYAWVRADLGLPRVNGIPSPKGESPIVQPFTREEVVALIRAAESIVSQTTERRASYTQTRASCIRNVAIILFLLDTGLRAGELIRLRVEDVNQDTGRVLIRPHRSGRKSSSRMVYLGRQARRRLWAYLATRAAEDTRPDDPLFTNPHGRPLTRGSLEKMIGRIARRAGVSNAHPHRFRHTFAIEYLRSGGDVFTLQQLLGHRSMEMVRRYLALAQADIQEAHRRHSPGDRLTA